MKALPPAQQVPRRRPSDYSTQGPALRQNRRRIGHVSQRSRRPRHRRPNHHRAARCRAEPPSVNQSPVVAISIAPGVPEMVQLRRSEVGATPPAKPPGMTMTDKIAVPPDIRMQQIVIGAMAPNDSPHTANDIPAAQGAPPSDIVGTRILPGTATTPRTTNDLTVQPEGAPSASALAEPPRAEAGARQGMIILDGAQLGRWMMDHLERHASRPGAMTTSFDPRMNAAYPGAPTGA